FLPRILSLKTLNRDEAIPPPRTLLAFIAHAPEDAATARELHETLKQVENIQPWLDDVDVLPGQKPQGEIQRAASKCNVMIVCVSSHAVNNEGEFRKEIRTPLDQVRAREDVLVVPVKLEASSVPAAEGLDDLEPVDL